MEESNRHLFDCNQCLFRQLSTRVVPFDEFELIRRTSVQLHFEKGETILRQGAASHHLVFLHRGLVKFSYHYDSGKKYIMTIVAGPKLLGAANLFFRQTNIFSLVAMEDCDVCLLDGKALRMVAQRHGSFVLDMCERTTEMFESAIFNFISMAHKQVHGRIADILLYLWNYIYKTRPDDFVITRKELAEFAACSHENVIHTLSRFNKEGILSLEGRKIVICDMERLQEISKRG